MAAPSVVQITAGALVALKPVAWATTIINEHGRSVTAFLRPLFDCPDLDFITRLDNPCSGLVLAGFSAVGCWEFARQVQLHLLERAYLVVLLSPATYVVATASTSAR
eukprot:NODE_13086_length_1186_cov_3.836638.p3 GENE.NODE_13086_length_1186_cov_3.836638~~NODE_13086_length_1186_cov_3.836638.p3  ORF type:complete len:107 (-),score=24.44 NODE_13086_length_1186_cov_3.836638:503-823(-)